MKILLVQPPSAELMVGFTSMVRPEPLALELIAASVPEHDVRIIDLRVDPTLDETLASFQPRVVGVTGYTSNMSGMLDICQTVKSFDLRITTVLGGYHATLCSEDFDTESVDIIVAGEGEVTFRELVEALEAGNNIASVNGLIYRENGRQVKTPARGQMKKPDNLPLPARHLTDKYRSKYHFQLWDNPYLVETARGCPYRCSFCAVWKFHQGKYRAKAPEAIIQDLKKIPSTVACFVDDNFLDNVRRVDRLYQMIKAENIHLKYWMQGRADTIVKHPDIIKKWAEIGLESILVGFETFDQEKMSRYDKKGSVSKNEKAMEILLSQGVEMWGSFIVDPQWTEADFDAMINYVKGMQIRFPLFTVLTPIPGTTFFEEHCHHLTSRKYELFDFLHCVLPTNLPIKDFYDNLARLYASTTMTFKDLKQRIRSGRIPPNALTRMKDVLRDVTNPQAYMASI